MRFAEGFVVGTLAPSPRGGLGCLGVLLLALLLLGLVALVGLLVLAY